MSSKFGQIRPRITELAALECQNKYVLPLSRMFFYQSFSYLQVTKSCRKARRSSKFGQICPPTAQFAVLERLKKIPIDFKWEEMCCPFSQLFLIVGSFSYLHVIMTYITARMSLKFGQIQPRTIELAALECKK